MSLCATGQFANGIGGGAVAFIGCKMSIDAAYLQSPSAWRGNGVNSANIPGDGGAALILDSSLVGASFNISRSVATRGGAIAAIRSTVSCQVLLAVANVADSGGALWVESSQFYSSSACAYTDNVAAQSG